MIQTIYYIILSITSFEDNYEFILRLLRSCHIPSTRNSLAQVPQLEFPPLHIKKLNSDGVETANTLDANSESNYLGTPITRNTYNLQQMVIPGSNTIVSTSSFGTGPPDRSARQVEEEIWQELSKNINTGSAVQPGPVPFTCQPPTDNVKLRRSPRRLGTELNAVAGFEPRVGNCRLQASTRQRQVCISDLPIILQVPNIVVEQVP